MTGSTPIRRPRPSGYQSPLRERARGRLSDASFPWNQDVESYFERKTRNQQIQTRIQMAVLTRFGERVMRPGFGSLVPETPFEPNDPALHVILENALRVAVPAWVPEVEILNITIIPQETLLTVGVTWRDRSDQATDSFEEFRFDVPQGVLRTLG